MSASWARNAAGTRLGQFTKLFTILRPEKKSQYFPIRLIFGLCVSHIWVAGGCYALCYLCIVLSRIYCFHLVCWFNHIRECPFKMPPSSDSDLHKGNAK